MRTAPPVPTQHEVDCLAAFIEAAEEMANEPFFSPDDKRKITVHGNEILYEFGDRFHFRSALVSFRRIWLENEASNFTKITKILSKYEGDGLIPWIREQHEQLETSRAGSDIKLSGKEIVNLWLNAVFAHNNINQKRRKPDWWDRIDFEKYDDKYGHELFEFVFRSTVHSFGLCYLNLLRLVARSALARWQKELNVNPSFRIGAPFGHSLLERTEAGHVIVRRASTQFNNKETPQQKMTRLLERHEFWPLANVLKSLRLQKRKLIMAISRSACYMELTQKVGFEMIIQNDLELRKLYDAIGQDETLLAVLPELDPYKGQTYLTAVYEGHKIVSNEVTLRFLDDKFRKLKGLLCGS